MIRLTDEQKKYIKDNNYGDIIIDEKKYCFKLCDKKTDGIQLVVEDLAELVGINCVHYERVIIENKPYIINEYIVGTKNFKTAFDIYEEAKENDLYSIWQVLEKKYPKYIAYLMTEIVKIYLFDLLILNKDKDYSNWGIKFNQGQVEKVYTLDNEYSLENNKKISFDNLSSFLNTSSNEFINLFNSMFYMLNPDTILYCLNDIEDEIGDGFKFNPKIYQTYLRNYEEIGKLFDRGLKC